MVLERQYHATSYTQHERALNQARWTMVHGVLCVCCAGVLQGLVFNQRPALTQHVLHGQHAF
jgi:hypothetical protein